MSKPEQPPIADLKGLAGYHIRKDSKHLIAGWKGLLGVAGLMFLLGFGFAWTLVVASKNATIETLTTANTDKASKIETLNKDYEKLSKQNADLKQALIDRQLPVKKRATILAQQLTDLAKRFDKNNAANWQSLGVEYQNRFLGRIETVVSQLDEMGQHSEVLDKNLRFVIGDHDFGEHVLTLAKELDRLAGNLKSD